MADSYTGWSLSTPADGALISEIPKDLREGKGQLAARIQKEHIDFATAGGGGEHLPGSAIAYVGATDPTTRPDDVTTISAYDVGRLFIDTNNKLLNYCDATGAFVTARTSNPWAKLTHAIIAQSGGSAVATTWTIRPITAINNDACSIVHSLTNNVITLHAGTYKVRISAAFCRCDACKIRLVSADLTTVYVEGTTQYSASAGTYANVWSEVLTEFTLTEDTALQVEYYVETARSAGGLGWGFAAATNVFLQMYIEQINYGGI